MPEKFTQEETEELGAFHEDSMTADEAIDAAEDEE